MLPITFLNYATNHHVMIELKNGETYHGLLSGFDRYLNLTLQNVLITSRDGEHFTRMNSCTIKGAMIKSIRLPANAIDEAAVAMANEVQRYQIQTGTDPTYYSQMFSTNGSSGQQSRQRRSTKKYSSSEPLVITHQHKS
ncbi:putative LSM4 like protein [Blattamonas nauphoetae]|uniref:U6 snRNA-associated Sm-like protein LSm4 n=1 Tax=Blattamonas nauphoetae TaxID=2049346 RepID=A0ABQ9YKG4_9EUKA|nr:putative LSM4 like protein [Blattamonas nauphoetae]